MYSPFLAGVLYAGLAGTFIALVVATAQQKWQPRVFFLLALRLAIGWHFLFEGLHKLNSHNTGPTDTNRVFTSEPYFKVAPGPIGADMRKKFNDTDETFREKVKAPREIAANVFAGYTADEQAAACPAAVAGPLDAMAGNAEAAVAAMKAAAAKESKAADADEARAVKDIDEREAVELKAATTAHEKKLAKDKAADERAKAKEKADAQRSAAKKKDKQFQSGTELLVAAKATYARWVYGVDGRDCEIKGISGPVSLTAPERLARLDWLRDQVKLAATRREPGLGNGNGTDTKRAAEWRTDLVTAEAELARDANAFIAELKQILNSNKPVEEPPAATEGQKLDKLTMWFLIVTGSFLLAGFLTRVACVLAAGFLVMTYLAHPAFPWYPAPPNTEGNPVFVNKNVIECIALLALACVPTGRWLGVDALLYRVIFGKDKPAEETTAARKN